MRKTITVIVLVIFLLKGTESVIVSMTYWSDLVVRTGKVKIVRIANNPCH